MKAVKLEELRESAVLLAQAPPLFARGLLYGFFFLLAVLLAWSWLATVPVVVRAEGRVRPAGRVWKVDSEIGGRIVSVQAREHQRVEKDAVLVKLDPAPLQLELGGIEREIGHLVPERDELERLAELLSRFEPGGPLRTEGLSRYRERFVAWARELEVSALNVRKQREELARLKDLGNIVAAAQIESARLTLDEAQSNYTLARAQHRAQVERDLESAKDRLRSLEAQRDQKKDALSRVEIRSPIDGTVTSASVHHQGEVVSAGQPLFQVVPQGAGYVAEVWVPGREAGFIEEGMEARVEVLTFPESTFGWLPGKVKAVSPDVEEGAPGGGSLPLYRVEITLTKDTLTATDGRVGKIRLGLLTRARLVVHEERVLFLLIGILRDAFRS
jgi:multidrug resistance efflux pump